MWRYNNIRWRRYSYRSWCLLGSNTNPPTISDNKTTDGDGAGTFTSEITGLVSNTTYHARAYAKNSIGIRYGNTISFVTAAPETSTLTDIDGNIYQTVKIVDQWWMAENLKVTHYRNGEAIPNVIGNTEWSNLSNGAYCSYANNNSKINTYGLLYNWYAVDDSRGLAPAGWHVPTDEEWKQLEMYLGMSQSDANDDGFRGTYEGNKLKATSGWNSGGNGTNSSGFSALPGGYRYGNGSFYAVGNGGYLWSSSEFNSDNAWYRQLHYASSGILRYNDYKPYGLSVRCVKD